MTMTSHDPNREPCDLCEHRREKCCGGSVHNNIYGVPCCHRYKTKWWPDTEARIAEENNQ